ncbi:MAG TPA: bifunctional precorrin-2 dehydrogenase/sirohydrochlorin ferrochelatase [Acidimicrobiales bacterium]|jgi:siroheme synthase-like protein|nr:bifunctional precorrin-2 dehydrogenase/sirohydrochlorin ferrochelatase [Acidimicrobiales bacterium]
MPVSETLYPVGLVVAGKRVVVVGGGTVAARKVEALVDAGARVTVVAPAIGAEVRRLPVDLVERPYRTGDLEGAWLAIAATDDPEVNHLVHADGQGARVWVNAADDPAACDFTLPAVLRRGPVSVAVSTGGRSPALAGWLRDQVAAQLGDEIGQLAEMLSEARDELQAAGRSTEGLDWRRALDSDMLDLIRKGRMAQARERLQACLS